MKTNNILPVFLATSLLTACGGSSSTTGTTTGGTTTGGTSTTTTLADANNAYSGNRNLALLNTANSMEFVNLVFGTENINDNITAPRPADDAEPTDVTMAQGSLLQPQRILSELAAGQIASQRYQARAVNESDTCPGGGTAAVTGELNDTSFTGTLQVTYNQCKSENVITNGSALLVIHAVNILAAQPTAYTVSMKGLGIRVDDVPYTATGTLRTDVNVTTGQNTLTINQYQRNLSTGKQQLAENVRMLVENSGHTDISGKFCEGVQGCVTATTIKPFLFAADGVPLEGEILISGAANSKLQVIAQGYDTSTTPAQRKLLVNLDANGDGVYESPSIRNESVLKNFSMTPNTAPQAVASMPVSTTLGATLYLDGSKTTDPEGDFLTYLWTLESAPEGSTATLGNANSVAATFTPDKQGPYTFSLKVTDALGSTHLATSSVTVMGAALPLVSNAIDAGYSDSLDRLVTVSSLPDNTLNIINPNSGRQQTLALQLPPTSVALSKDGITAVVGHDGAITHVDLETLEILNFYGNIGFKVFDIALGDNGRAYATPPAAMNWSYLYVIDLATGTVQEDVNASNNRLFGGAHLQAVPGLQAVYTLDTSFPTNDLNRYDTSAAQPAWRYDSPYHGQYDVGATASNLWVTDDGMTLLTAGGTLFQTADQQEADLRYQRTLSDDDGKAGTYLLHADHSQKAAKFVAVEAADGYSLKTYTTPLLNRETSLSLKGMSINGSSDVVKPGFAFFNAAGTERYALLAQGSNHYLMAF